MKRLQNFGLVLACALTFAALFMAYRPLAATSGVIFSVNSTADAVDFSPGDGICETAVGNNICTLRAAVQETNALAGPDTIQIPAGTYTLMIPGIDTAAAMGDLDILDDLTIIGAGVDQTIIDGNQLDRVVHVVCVDYSYPIIDPKRLDSCPTDISVSISNVTIQNGLTQSLPAGAGIFNNGTLTLDNVTIFDNESTQGFGNNNNGGGVFSYGTLTMTHSLVISNTAGDGFGSGIGLGSIPPDWEGTKTYISNSQITGNNGYGISLFQHGTELIIEKSLVSENGAGVFHNGAMLFINEVEIVNNAGSGIISVPDPGNLLMISHSNISGNGHGGVLRFKGGLFLSNSTISNNSSDNFQTGLFLAGVEEVKISNTTIARNSAPAGAGIYINNDVITDVEISNTIIAENTGGNCIGVLAAFSVGNNLEDGADCNFTASGDIQNTDPLLGPLQYNGGATSTHALLPGSPAADSGNDTICQSPPVNNLDQRRYSRVGQDGNMDGGSDGDPCDIGAFEISVAPTSVQQSGQLQGIVNNRLPLFAISISVLTFLLLIGWRYSLVKKAQ